MTARTNELQPSKTRSRYSAKKWNSNRRRSTPNRHNSTHKPNKSRITKNDCRNSQTSSISNYVAVRTQREQCLKTYGLQTSPLDDCSIGHISARRTSRIKSKSLEGTNPKQLNKDLHRERAARTKTDAQIRTRLSQCEDELGINKPDAIAREQGGEDVQHLSKLERFIRYGPEAVTERVYDVHERAREIALHFGEWGKKISDANGKRIQLRSKKDKLKTHLEAAFERRFQWNEVYRAIDKLAEIAYGTQLECKKGTHDEGKYVLELKISDGRGPSFARGHDK